MRRSHKIIVGAAGVIVLVAALLVAGLVYFVATTKFCIPSVTCPS